MTRLIILCLPLLFISCTHSETDNPQNAVQVGAERLLEQHRDLIKGKKVGVITNQSALAGEEHIVDLLDADPDVEVEALFGPEHGIRGEADAGEEVDDSVDEKTGVTVFSLYGENNRPSQEMLENIDVLIFDIQDVGTRFYTYPATMGRSMKSAAEADIPFLVLDRPNPLGGEQMEGHIQKDEFISGIGRYPTPVTHGMTVGELARMIKGEGWHDGLENVDLHVVEMEGWTRDMLWDDTGLEWTPPSPNIPDVETAVVYPGTCFFEGTNASEGRGTYGPFLKVGSPHVEADQVAEEIESLQLPGLEVGPVEFIPESIPNMASEPKLLDEQVNGVQLGVLDAPSVKPVAAGIHLLQEFYEAIPEEHQEDFFIKRGMDIRAGNEEVQQKLEEGEDAKEIIESWKDDVNAFQEQRSEYLLYE